jgi:cytochrome c biogenesis protein CcmG/thiol:disulfide interchange protein DsbE
MEGSQIAPTPDDRGSVASDPPKRGWISGAVFLLVLGGLTALFLSAPGKLTSASLLGSEAPDFEITAINGEHAGRRIALRELRGQVVVLNFWASWCVECDAEMADLEQAWRTYRDRGVVFVGASYMDLDGDSIPYLERFGITYPNGPDMGTRISKSYRVTGVPETIFIDRDGRVGHIRIGPISSAELRLQIVKLLERAPAAGSGADTARE